MKQILFSMLLIITTMFANDVYAGGGSSKSGGGSTPIPTSTKGCAINLDWGFGTEALKGAGIIYYCGNIPESQSYLYNNSASSKTSDNTRYYCEIKVASNDNSYNKTYTWVAGNSMNIAVPSNKTFKVTVTYLERWASGCYSYGGNARISYTYTTGFTSAPACIFAKMTFAGYIN